MLRKRFQIHALAVAALSAFFLLGMCNETYANESKESLVAVDWIMTITKNDAGQTVKVELDNFETGQHIVVLDLEAVLGNPSPAGDDYPEPGDQSSREALAKQEGGEQKASAVNLITMYQTASGKGISVVWDPSDDQGGGGAHGPQSVKQDGKEEMHKKLEKMLAKIKGMVNGDVNGFQFNGQSPGEQAKGAIKNGEADDRGDSKPPGWKQAQMENARLGEVYNPNPVDVKSRGFLLMGAAQFGAAARVGNGLPAATQFGGAARVGNGFLVPTQIGRAANSAFNGQRNSPGGSSQLFSAAAFGPLSGPAAVLRPVAAPRTVR